MARNMSESSDSVSVLSIAGSDPSAGAGSQGDLQTILALNARPLCVVTAITAQNTKEVRQVQPVDADLISQQLAAISTDFPIHAIKTGLLPTKDCMNVVVEFITDNFPHIPLVVDPVLQSSTGRDLVGTEVLDAYCQDLLPIASLVTPNKLEAEFMTGSTIKTVDDAKATASQIIELGAKAVLLKGGHFEDALATDILVTEAGVQLFEGEAVSNTNVHGTGCAFASAIACWLARDKDLKTAITLAKTYITSAIKEAYPLGEKALHLQHFPSSA